MNSTFRTLLLIFTAIASSSLAQAPPQAKPSNPPAPITSKDVRVLPFVRDLYKTSLDGKRGYPDELRVITTPNKIHLSGKKRGESVKVEGRNIGHYGKLALLTPADRSGKLFIKVPPADDVTYYYAVLELRDGSLEPKDLTIQLKKTYDWSFKSEGGQSIFRISDGPTEIVSLSAPTEKIKGYGFSSTVRWKDNEADLTVTVE